MNLVLLELDKYYSKIYNYNLNSIYFFLPNPTNNTGNKIKFVKVLTNNVNEVSHPNADIPPKLLKQNTIKPAINTNEVYTILIPV